MSSCETSPPSIRAVLVYSKGSVFGGKLLRSKHLATRAACSKSAECKMSLAFKRLPQPTPLFFVKAVRLIAEKLLEKS